MDRNNGKKVLSSMIQLQKNIDAIENAIYNLTIQNSSKDDSELYNNYIYQVIGILLENKSLKSLLDLIKNNRLEWEQPIFQKYQLSQQEQDDFIIKPIEVQEGVLQCPKCGSKYTYTHTQQTRKADESMSVYIRCANPYKYCGFKWKL